MTGRHLACRKAVPLVHKWRKKAEEMPAEPRFACKLALKWRRRDTIIIIIVPKDTVTLL